MFVSGRFYSGVGYYAGGIPELCHKGVTDVYKRYIPPCVPEARCGYEVPGMTLLHDCFNLHQLQFQCSNSSCVDVVVLIRCMFLHLVAEMSDWFF
jgi:hypothetical protein